MAKKTEPPEGVESRPADPELELGPKLIPVKMQLARMADWAGGRESIPLGGDSPYRLLRREPEGVVIEWVQAKKAFFVPHAFVRFVEFDIG